MPCSTSNIITDWPTWKYATSSQSGTAIREHYLDLSQNRDDQNKLSGGRSHAANYAPRSGTKCGPLCTPLTTRHLREHDMQNPDISRPPDSLCVYQYDHDIMHRVPLVITNGKLHNLNNDAAGCFNSNSLDSSYQTQCQQQGTESMFNEADNDSPDYQSAILWKSGLNDQDTAMDVLEPDINAVDLPSWDMNPDQKLTAWGNDLAGIGGRFC